MILYTLLVWCLFAFVHPIEIDNSLDGNPLVDCQDTMVSLTFQTEKPFTGRVYVKGLADDERCSRNFATNPDQNKFSMMIGQGDCNMKRTRNTEGPMEGLVFSLVIVVSFHGTFVTKADRAFRCMCFFRNIKRVTNLLDMSMIPTTELLDTAKMPSCSYTIRNQSPEGELVRYGKIGDKIFHVWECDDPDSGFLVHSCWVNDGRGNRFDLLDIDGCAIDPIIQPDVTYREDLTKAWAETHGYKFSDTSVLDYMCVLELCQKNQGECNGLTPPVCGRGKRSVDIIEVRASQPHIIEEEYNRNEMDVTTSLNIIDTLEDFTNKQPAALLDDLNGFGSSTRIKDRMCFSTPAFGVLIAVTLLMFMTSLSSAFFICYRRSASLPPKL